VQKYLIIGSICLIIGITGGVLCGWKLSGDGSRISQTIRDYEQIIKSQSATISRLGDISKQLGGISDQTKNISNGIGQVNTGLDGIKSIIGRSQDAANESAKLITEQQGIIDGIKKRGK
jgi:methyl-accepting chemotaxis protein